MTCTVLQLGTLSLPKHALRKAQLGCVCKLLAPPPRASLYPHHVRFQVSRPCRQCNVHWQLHTLEDTQTGGQARR